MHGRRACAHGRTEGLLACTRLCVGRSVTTGFLGCSVTTEMAHSMSRHRLWCRNRGAELLGCCVATQPLCRDSGAWTCVTEEYCRDREFSFATDSSIFSIVTGFSRTPVAIAIFLLRQSLSIWCRNKVGVRDRARSVHNRARSVCTLCT